MKKYLLLIFALCLQNVLMAQTKYSFRGRLGQDISFRMDLEQNSDGIVAGETTYYRKNGKVAKIPVYGWMKNADNQGFYNGDALFLTEYDGTKQCGTFVFGIDAQGLPVEGSWSWHEKELDINSVEKTIFPSGVKYLNPAKGQTINGEYSFSYTRSSGMEDCGGSCTLKYTNGQVHYNVCTVTPNIAEEKKTAKLNGSYFTGSHDEYRYKAYIDRKFVCIWATNSGQVDDWGAWATIDGIYVKK